MAKDVDLFVIGGGSGGVRAARVAAGYGARVMLAEEYRLGGTCVIRGCVPKKLMVYAGRFSDEFEDAARYGWSLGEPTFDWSVLKKSRDAEILRLEGIYGSLLAGSKVEVVKERATIEDPHTVRLASGRLVTAEHILVAVGGEASMEPVIPGGELGMTSNDVFEIETQPKDILVVGAGYIAVEFAGIFAGLGTRTAMLHRGDKLLRGFDEDLRDALGDAYTKRGIELLFGRTIGEIARRGERVAVTLSDGAVREFDRVLVATGRRPNTAGLGFEHVGIQLDPKTGAVPVDAFSQTSVPSIWAVGDVTDRANLTPVAIREGHAFADTVFGGNRHCVDHGLIPTAVFSTPEIGTVGMSEEGARSRHGDDVVIFKASFRPMKATISGRDERTLMKIIAQRSTDRVLGVHMLGHDAGEIIQMAGIAMTMGATKADFDRTIAVHPTAAEEFVTMRTPVG